MATTVTADFRRRILLDTAQRIARRLAVPTVVGIRVDLEYDVCRFVYRLYAAYRGYEAFFSIPREFIEDRFGGMEAAFMEGADRLADMLQEGLRTMPAPPVYSIQPLVVYVAEPEPEPEAAQARDYHKRALRLRGQVEIVCKGESNGTEGKKGPGVSRFARLRYGRGGGV